MTRRIVVVGAGPSGIPLAARLGEQGHDVVLIEAGPLDAGAAHPKLLPALESARTVRAGLPDSPLAVAYETELLPGRPWRTARGRLLGGGSAVNGGLFQRPHPDDFVLWERAGGAAWSYSACLAALRRLEHDLDFGAEPVHGRRGPMPVRRWGADDPLTRAFLDAAVALGAIVEEDKNSGGMSGVGLLPCNVVGSRRHGVAEAYRPLLGAVAIRTATATRIRLDSGTAVGVELRVGDETDLVEADEVVLCAGAIETPRLLFASGIGDPRHPDGGRVATLPGVGRGLSDHPAITLPWLPRDGAVPSNAPTAWSAGWNGTTDEAPFEILLPVVPTAALLSGDPGVRGALDLRVSLSRTRSRGEIRPPGTGPDVRYGYLAHSEDLRALAAAVRAAATMLRTGPLSVLVEAADLPEWAVAERPLDEAEAWLRSNVGTAIHSCGTARMGDASDPLAVVDEHGRVHGVAGLRIADASILSPAPARGTALLSVMIGERIAELMAEEDAAAAH